MKNSYPKPLTAGSRPNPTALPDPTCPIFMQARGTLNKAHDLHHAIRQLRRSTQRCVTCPERSACTAMSYFAQAVDTAIRELRAEWGIDSE